MMRYLRAPNQFQLRLGWLSVIAAIVGEERAPRAEVEKTLLQIALGKDRDAQARWLAEAGLGSPYGKLSRRAAPEIVRMATVYGIYDPDAQALTDLGQVLFATARWRPERSPFCWQGASQFVGTRVLFGANGDVAMEVLRSFPADEGLPGEETPAFLAVCLELLAHEANVDEDRQKLFAQAERARDPSFRERVYRELVYPHLEPLRELGYLISIKPGEYTLTEAGRRFIDSAPPGRAEDLLRNGLASAVLSAEGVPLSMPADAEMLRQTLLRLPGPLLGAHAEASLEAVVLLTQAHLFAEKPGRWIDMDRAAELLGLLEQSTGGRIGLKAGRSPEEQNVTWREQAYLDDAQMWRVDADPAPPSVQGDAQLYAPSSPSGPAQMPSGGPAPLPEGHEPPATPTQVPLNPHALLWLSYVEQLLAPPTLGDIGGIRRGGPVSWIASLRKLLDVPEDKLKAKRAKGGEKDPQSNAHGHPTIATGPLRRWLERLDSKIEIRAYAQCARLWSPADGNLTHPEDLRGAFLWADASAERLRASLVRFLREFVERDDASIRWDEWDAVREATRGLLDDALHLGLWHAPELLGRVGTLSDAGRETAAGKLIEELTAPAPRRTFGFTQEFSVLSALLEALDALPDRTLSLDGATVEMGRSADDLAAPQSTLSIRVALQARTEEQAMSRGAEYAAEAVSRLAFLGTLRMPFGAAGDSASIRPQGDGRLTDEQGTLYRPPERRDAGIFFERPEDLGIRQARPIDGDLIGVVRELPALAAIDRGVALDGRARLARSLHWLALADAPHLRPAERLSHGWVAFEHLFADGEQKGHLVAELSAPVVALCFVRATAGRLYRDALAALHVSACRNPGAGALEGLVERWLGPISWARYATRGPGSVVPLPEPREVADQEGLERLLEHRSDHQELAAAVQAHAPLVAWQLQRLDKLLGQREELARWLGQRQRDAASFLMGVYEVRNQLVHDANPFGFDDAYRLRDLYERYRVTINPVVAEVLRLVGSDLKMPLKHAWALLRARFGELLAQQTSKTSRADPVNTAALLGCFT